MSKNTDRLEQYRSLLQDTLQFIWTHPETGYKEWETHSYLVNAFKNLGYDVVEAGDIPGFYAELDTGRPGPCVLVMGELDALNCPNHPEQVNGMAHTCGHCAQATALLGIAAALSAPDALEGLCGKIRLMGVPAEEMIEADYRDKLRLEGKIKYFGGKPEFLRRGLMDGVDMAVMIHTNSALPPHTGLINGGSNGMVAFTAAFKGVASHAGGAPEKGVNALYAANQALSAINALRETFPDKDHIRVHPIITEGGSAVNIIPDKVVIESFVRGSDMDTLLAVKKKVDRALAASAASVGAGVVISTRPGYYVRKDDPGMDLVMKEAMEEILETTLFRPDTWGSGSTDMGDISAIMPALHPYISGASGHSHGNDFFITSFDSAVMDSAKVQLRFLELLLENGAARALEILKNFKPVFASKEDYFAMMDSLISDVDAVRYNDDGSVCLLI